MSEQMIVDSWGDEYACVHEACGQACDTCDDFVDADSVYELDFHEVYSAGQEFLMEKLEMMYGANADMIADEFGLGFLESLGDDMGVIVEFISDPTSILF